MTKTLFYGPFPDGSARHSKPAQKADPTSAKERWCKLAIVPPLHILQILNETSPNFLEHFVMLPSTHVQNLARCSIYGTQKRQSSFFFQKCFPRCTIKYLRCTRFIVLFQYYSRRAPLFKVLLASLARTL